MATKEEIEKAIEEDKYDHITSSYYLLADKQQVLHHPSSSLAYGDHLVARQPRIDVTMARSPVRARSCSLDELGKANQSINNFYKPPHIR